MAEGYTQDERTKIKIICGNWMEIFQLNNRGEMSQRAQYENDDVGEDGLDEYIIQFW